MNQQASVGNVEVIFTSLGVTEVGRVLLVRSNVFASARSVGKSLQVNVEKLRNWKSSEKNKPPASVD